MIQLSLLDALRTPLVIQPVAPHGEVIQGRADESFVLPHPRLAWPLAQIDLHKHIDGMWMWGVKFSADHHGGGYRVGPKWGKFAATRDDALFYAARELRANLDGDTGSSALKIRVWLASIAPEAA